MRTAVLVASTVLVLGIAFAGYLRLQAGAKSKDDNNPLAVHAGPAPHPEAGNINHIGRGKRVEVESYDDKTGELSSRFSAAEYVPQKDGTVNVTSPAADFYRGGEHIRIWGDRGNVVVQNSPGGNEGPLGKTTSGPPSRGRLENVIVTMAPAAPGTEGAAATRPALAPTLRITMNNASFDNETFTISTEGYADPATGRNVPADQVPVTVRGDYDFDGRGLTLRWNDQDGRLELLDIAHGERLEIKHPGGVTGLRAGPDRSPAAPPAPAPVAAPAPIPAAPPAPDLAAAPTAEKPAGPPATRKRPPQPVYLASFSKAVKITQGNQLLATADEMDINFLLRQDTESPSPGAKKADPATRNAAAANSLSPSPGTPGEGGGEGSPASQSRKDPHPDTPSAPGASENAGKPSPATQPATAPAAEEVPVIITWSGRLRVTPQQGEPPVKIVEGNAAVRLIGTSQPVLLRRDPAGQEAGDLIRCASLIYQTADGSALIEHSAAFPQISLKRLKAVASGIAKPGPPQAAHPATTQAAQPSPDQEDGTVVAASLDYSAANHVAVLGGPGVMSMPVELSGPARPNARAAWSQSCRIFLSPGRQQSPSIERAEFRGDVDVEHPQLSLKSQSLDLGFDQPAPAATRQAGPAGRTPGGARADIHRVHAEGDVVCHLTDSAGKKQHIECGKLDLVTAHSEAGKLYARQITADDRAHAYDAEQDLRAGHIELVLRPTAPATRPAASARPAVAGPVDSSGEELEIMTARDAVRVTSHDGAVVTADDLAVVMEPDGPHVRLSGNRPATVTDEKKNQITGPVILIQPKNQQAQVVGPGTLHMLRPEAGEKTGRPLDVSWASRADLDGPADRIDLYGKPQVTGTDADGARNDALADHIHIDLQKKPPAPTTRPARQAAAATRPAAPASAAGNMDLFKDKEARAVRLEGSAVVKSTSAAANGDILRQFELKGDEIIYTLLGNVQTPGRSLLVPGGGQMLVRDHRPPEKHAAATGANGGLEGGRGATAFQWAKQLLYTEDNHRAVMTGDVLIAHQGDGDKELPLRLRADTVTADFSPERQKAATQGTAAAEEPAALALKHLTAVGGISVLRGTSQLVADRIDYEPLTHWMTAAGSETAPATYSDTQGTSLMSASVLEWNTQTWNIRSSETSVRGSQRAPVSPRTPHK